MPDIQSTQISDGQNLSVTLLNYGARIVRINVSGLQLACTYEKSADYLRDPYYLGPTVGPIANRIAGGRLTILEQDLQMPQNEGENSLHSGGNGFDKQYWELAHASVHEAVYELRYDQSLAGMNGVLYCTAHYLAENGKLIVEYKSHCNETTYINPTNHVYLNLSGSQAPIDDHHFELFADSFVEVDQNSIPTGVNIPLPKPFSYNISEASSMPQFAGYCDHHFNVGDPHSDEMRSMLTAISKTSGIRLEVRGNSPGFQFYTGAFLAAPFAPSGGFCVETQLPPDAINQPGIPAPLLQPGQVRRQITEFKFSVVGND